MRFAVQVVFTSHEKAKQVVVSNIEVDATPQIPMVSILEKQQTEAEAGGGTVGEKAGMNHGGGVTWCGHMYVCMYVYVYIYVCMHVGMYVRMYVCMYARLYVCMYVCMYIYVCMYVCM